MKIKRVYVEAKKSLNYQTYTVGMDVEIVDNEPETTIKVLQAKCRQLVNEQIKIDQGGKIK